MDKTEQRNILQTKWPENGVKIEKDKTLMFLNKSLTRKQPQKTQKFPMKALKHFSDSDKTNAQKNQRNSLSIQRYAGSQKPALVKCFSKSFIFVGSC